MTFIASTRQSTGEFSHPRYRKTPKYLTKVECFQYLDKWNTDCNYRAENLAGFTDDDYLTECITITKTKCLHWLETWCIEYNLTQTKWDDLCLNIYVFVSSKGSYRMKPQTFCAVREEINAQESESTAIFQNLGLRMENMRDAYYPLGIPSGEPNHEIKDGNRLIGSIWLIANGYRLPNSDRWGSGDPYTEALKLFPKEEIQPIRLQVQAKKLQLSTC